MKLKSTIVFFVLCQIILNPQGGFDVKYDSEPTTDIKRQLSESVEIPDGNAIISRSEGVAPLGVHFKADYTVNRDSLGNFHTLEYQWNFGDEGTGVWGTDGLSKNTESGPITTHVFELPGTYTITLTVRKGEEILKEEAYTVTVLDPDIIYNGSKTICVSRTGDFTGAPAGAQQIKCSDLSTITRFAQPGTRILFKRGDSWNVEGDLDFPDNAGPVQLGAFGEGINPDEIGLYENAPKFIVNNGTFCNIDHKQNWRFTDLSFIDHSGENGSIGGTMDMQRILFLNLKVEGFRVGLGWSHWNDADPLTINEMMIVNSRVSDSKINCLYVGSERLAVLGNVLENAQESHVLRIWQAFRGVVSHNRVSGASVNNANGRQALKLHGPGDKRDNGGGNEYGKPIEGTSLLANLTEQVVISNNIFGSSGPWPVTIGPQDDLEKAEILNIIFEKNRLITEYGKYNNRDVLVALNVWAQCVTIRDNIFDGTGSGNDYIAIQLGMKGKIIPTKYIDILSNTVYRSDNRTGNYRYGVNLGSDTSDVRVIGNRVSFPKAKIPVSLILGECTNLVMFDNIYSDKIDFIDSDNSNPLERKF